MASWVRVQRRQLPSDARWVADGDLGPYSALAGRLPVADGVVGGACYQAAVDHIVAPAPAGFEDGRTSSHVVRHDGLLYLSGVSKPDPGAAGGGGEP